jgi:hypothetical protein
MALDHIDLSRVLHSDQLRISSEDSLLDLILALGTDSFDLLPCLQTEYLSQSAMSRLLDSISREEIGDELWKSLCRRLVLYVPSTQLPESRLRGEKFHFDSSHPFNGIIAHLSTECGGNVHTHGIVSITASGNQRNACHQVVDYDWTDYWYSPGAANAWIQFDFKARRISPTHYTIKSGGDDGHHLLIWSFDGSDDGTSWTTLDQQETKDLNDKYAVKSYECGSVQSSGSFFRFIRLTQTGKNSSGGTFLDLANLEVFGDVVNTAAPESL